MNKPSGLPLRDGGRGFSPATMSMSPACLPKIKPKELPFCSIPRLLIAYTLQLAILVNDNPEIMLCPVCSSSLITWRQLELRQFRLVFFFNRSLLHSKYFWWRTLFVRCPDRQDKKFVEKLQSHHSWVYETGFIQGISQEVIIKQTFSILHWSVIDLPTPKRQKMWDYESRAWKSSEPWVKVVRCPKFPSGRNSRGDYAWLWFMISALFSLHLLTSNSDWLIELSASIMIG